MRFLEIPRQLDLSGVQDPGQRSAFKQIWMKTLKAPSVRISSAMLHLNAGGKPVSCVFQPQRRRVHASSFPGLRLRFQTSLDGSDGFALEFNAVTIGEYPLHDRVGERRAADQVVPFIDDKLAGHNRRSRATAIIEDFKQVLFLHIGQRRQSKIIDGNDICFGEFRRASGRSFHRRRRSPGAERTWATRHNGRKNPPGRLYPKVHSKYRFSRFRKAR